MSKLSPDGADDVLDRGTIVKSKIYQAWKEIDRCALEKRLCDASPE